MRSFLVLLMMAVPAAAQEAAKVTYDEHVMPIFRAKCLGCHNGDKVSGGLDLSTYTAMLVGGGSGEVIAPGDPNGSRLYRLMAHTEEPKMPPNSPKIDDASLKTVSDWIAGGALQNSGSKPLASKPKADVTLGSVVRGRPEVTPMPEEPLPLEPVVVTERTTAVTALAANPWSPLVAVGGQQQILLYNADTLELVGVLPFEPGVPHVLKFSRNGSLLLAAGGHAALSGSAVLYDVLTGEEIMTVGEETDAILAADISADQKQIAIGGPSKVIRIFSTETGEMVKEIRTHTDWVYQIEFSPDAVLLATGDRSGNLHVWESFSGNEFYTLKGHTDAITAMSWRADSNALATGSEDGSIRLWEMQNGNNYKNWNSHGGVQSLWYTHEGLIASCGRDRLTRLWDGDGNQKVQLPATPDLALRTAVTHDGKRVITGGWTGNVFVWNAEDGQELGQLSTNPPKLADRIAGAKQSVAAAQAAFDAAQQGYQYLENAVKQATDAVNAARQQRDQTAQAAQAAQAALENSKQAHTNAVVAQKTAAENLAKVRAENKPQPEIDAATQAVAAADAEYLKVTGELAQAAQAVTPAVQAAQNAAGQLPAQEKALADLQPQLANARTALDQAKATLDTATASLQRLEEAASLVKQ